MDEIDNNKGCKEVDTKIKTFILCCDMRCINNTMIRVITIKKNSTRPVNERGFELL